jgi:hypothetical protein
VQAVDGEVSVVSFRCPRTATGSLWLVSWFWWLLGNVFCLDLVKRGTLFDEPLRTLGGERFVSSGIPNVISVVSIHIAKQKSRASSGAPSAKGQATTYSVPGQRSAGIFL